MAQAYDRPWTWRDRWRCWLFPSKHCFAPDVPAHYKDCVRLTVVTQLDWMDRLRVLVTGIVVSRCRIMTEHECGNTVAASETYIGTKRELKGD